MSALDSQRRWSPKALEVSCPYCLAGTGEPCCKPSGMPWYFCHSARVSVGNGHEPSPAQMARKDLSSVTLVQIARQRSLGWPDFHPEDFCHQCGRRNAVWFVDSPLWNVATRNMRRGRLEILCPVCFVLALEAETGLSVAWELEVDDNCRDAAALHRVSS